MFRWRPDYLVEAKLLCHQMVFWTSLFWIWISLTEGLGMLSCVVSTIGKNLLSSNISSTCPHNMVNFGPLAAEIGSLVWGTPANFNWCSVTARHSSSGRQPNFAALNRGRHLYSAGPPWRWASAHILVLWKSAAYLLTSNRVDEIVVVDRAVNVVGSTRQLTSIAYAPQRMFNSHRRRD